MTVSKTSRLLAGLLLLLIATAAKPDVDDRNADSAEYIDSLFAAGARDSVMTVLPAALENARAGGDSSLVARLLIVRGRIELGYDASAAEATLDEARRTAEAARDTARWSDALGFKSIATTYLGRYRESIELNDRRLELTRATGDRIGEAWARTSLGYVCLRTGNLDAAREHYSAAAELFHSAGARKYELTPLVGLGRVLSAQQRTEAARECYLRAKRTAREVGDTGQEADALNNLGSLEYRYGDMAVAVRYFERAYQLNRDDGNTRGTIIPATNVALARAYLGQYADAAQILIRAKEACENGGHRDLYGMVICTLGQVRISQQRMNEAAILFRDALALGEGLTKKQHDHAVYGLAQALAAVDSVETAVGVLEKGLDGTPLPEFVPVMGQYLSKCLRRLGRSTEALERAKAAASAGSESGEHESQLFAAFELGAAYRDNGNIEKAYEWYMTGVDALEQFRRSTGEFEWREAHGRINEVVDGGSILLQFPRARSRDRRVEALFDVLQRFKARTLAERITDPRRQTDAAPVSDREPVTLSELRSVVLQPGELFLDFTVGEERTYLFAVTRDSCRLVELPGRQSDLPSSVAFYVEFVGRPATRPSGIGDPSRIPDAGIDTRRMGLAVYGKLLAGADDLIQAAGRIIFAPDSYLGAVPFGALPDPGGDRPDVLLDRREIECVPSATVLASLRSRPQRSGTGGVLALVPRDFERLRGANREIAQLRDLLSPVEIVAGKPDLAALESGFGACAILHVAAHVVVNDEKPWFSGILLETGEDAAPTPTASRERGADPVDSELPADPYLRAVEIAPAAIPAKLAVLAGCESALGRTSNGEGVIGLTSAFLSAGVPSVVSTLWKVDDVVTADLMAEFYEALAEGETVVSALRSAQRTIRAGASTAAPFYWAGFVVVGDGGIRVTVKKTRHVAKTIGLISVIVILLAVMILRRPWIRRTKKMRRAV